MNRLTCTALLVLATAASPLPALAQSQFEMNASARAKAQTADRALNAQYKATAAKLSAPSRTLLRDAQRRWIAFRDAECAWQASAVEGGSVHDMIHAECLERLTQERTRTLNAKANCEEGDLSCPR